MHTIASRELASLTLGDAGGAALVERAEHGEAGITFAGFTTISEHSRLCLAYPARHDPGHRMFTKSRALQDAAIADLPGVLREALDSSSLEIGDRPGDLDPDPSRCAAGHANISMYGDYYGIVNADTLVGADGRQWTRSKPAAPTLPTRT